MYCELDAVALENCIVWQNRGGSFYGTPPPAVLSSCVEGGAGAKALASFDENPRFARPGTWQDNGTPGTLADDIWVEGDYRLLPFSPCIDSGQPASAPPADWAGVARPRCAGPDIGAFEYPGSCPARFRRGDANADGEVTIADAIILLDYIFLSGRAPVCPDAADGNDDERVDVADAVRLLSSLFRAWGPLPPPFPACGHDTTPGSDAGRPDLPACEYPAENCGG